MFGYKGNHGTTDQRSWYGEYVLNTGFITWVLHPGNEKWEGMVLTSTSPADE